MYNVCVRCFNCFFFSGMKPGMKWGREGDTLIHVYISYMGMFDCGGCGFQVVSLAQGIEIRQFW